MHFLLLSSGCFQNGSVTQFYLVYQVSAEWAGPCGDDHAPGFTLCGGARLEKKGSSGLSVVCSGYGASHLPDETDLPRDGQDPGVTGLVRARSGLATVSGEGPAQGFRSWTAGRAFRETSFRAFSHNLSVVTFTQRHPASRWALTEHRGPSSSPSWQKFVVPREGPQGCRR